MRLHPVGPVMLPHQAIEDGVEIGGYEVPKGCTVIFNSWAIMRDPAVWERPEEFLPERFMDSRVPEVDFRGKEFHFLPFGSGRRMCPGMPMAERIVPFVLASLLQAFEWRLPDGVSGGVGRERKVYYSQCTCSSSQGRANRDFLVIGLVPAE
ncbi:hypothetical protein ACP70R_002527 [Stipagrostis hirtigluma subsp. patula]